MPGQLSPRRPVKLSRVQMCCGGNDRDWTHYQLLKLTFDLARIDNSRYQLLRVWAI